MKTQRDNDLGIAIDVSGNRADWTAAVVEDPAAARGSFRRAEYDRVLPLCVHVLFAFNERAGQLIPHL